MSTEELIMIFIILTSQRLIINIIMIIILITYCCGKLVSNHKTYSYTDVICILYISKKLKTYYNVPHKYV